MEGVVVEETLDIVLVSKECGRGEMVVWWFHSLGLVLLVVAS